MATTHLEDVIITNGLEVNSSVYGTGTFATKLFYSGGCIIDASAWAMDANGSMTLPVNKANKAYVIPLTGLKDGDIITGYSVLGACTGVTSNTVTLDAKFLTTTKGTGTVTCVSSDAMTQVSKAIAYAIDTTTTLSTPATVADDYHYAIWIYGTNPNHTSTLLTVNGVILECTKKFAGTTTAMTLA